MKSAFLLMGFGSMGKNHARVLSQLQSVSLSVFDPLGDYGLLPSGVIGLDEVGDPERFAGVIVATPSHVHMSHFDQDLRSFTGPILVEKPLSTTSIPPSWIDQAEGRVFVAQVERFNPTFAGLTGLLASESVISFEAERLGGAPAQLSSSDPILDLAIHDIDLLCWAADDFSPTGKIVDLITPEGSCVQSTAFLRLDERGIAAQVKVSYLHLQKSRKVTVRTHWGMTQFNGLLQSVERTRVEQVEESGPGTWNEMQYLRGGLRLDVNTLQIESRQPLLEQDAAFVNFCLSGELDERLTTVRQAGLLLDSIFSMERLRLKIGF